MSKIMRIELTEGAFSKDPTYLYEDDCPYIIKEVDNTYGKITDEDLNDAINVLIGAFVEWDMYNMVVNIDERNNIYAPTKEMTLKEIEKELGYKVKIVSK